MNLLKNLKILHLLERSKSISAAAKEIGMAPSGVSNILDDLENYFGYRLFHRSSKGLKLTDKAIDILPYTKALVSDADQLSKIHAKRNMEPEGYLRITAPTVFGRKYVVPAIAQFMQKYPKIVIDLTCIDEIQNIQQHGYELAIRIGPTTTKSAIIRTFSRSARLLVASPQYIAQLNTPLQHPEDLKKLSILSLETQTYWNLRHNSGHVIRIKPNPRYISRGADSLTEICLNGLGIALKSQWDIASHLKTGELIHILPEYRDEKDSSLNFVYPSSNYIDANAKLFATFFEQKIGNPPIWDEHS